ncbi:MAG: GNAT family N-acetyltransferase [Novosphingobium sp.]|nr:GNAT family N-acetyltransferase [Novosphingobium sp.]
MFIRSERLFLRPGWPEDWEEFHALISERSVMENLAREVWPRTAEEIRDFICRPRDKLLPHFFITVPSVNGARLAGGIGLGRDGEDVEIGYWIANGLRGKGYATEAVRAVLNLARALGHRRLVAAHFADNPVSARVLTKAGFIRTGEQRQRYNLGRGASAPADCFAIALDICGADGGGDAGGDGKADMRAA